MEDNNEQDYGLVILELLQVLKEKAAIILLVTLMAALLSWGISSFVLPRQYEASVNMIVNTSVDNTNAITNDNISSAQNLVDTYAIIIKSNTVLNQVIDRLELKMSYEELYDLVSVDAINRTQVMKIAARTADPAESARIVQTISDIAPAIVADAVEAGSCKVVSQVYSDNSPVSPNVTQNTVVFGFMGLLAAAAFVVLRELLHDDIVDDADMEKKLGIPALGVIPDVEGR